MFEVSVCPSPMYSAHVRVTLLFIFFLLISLFYFSSTFFFYIPYNTLFVIIIINILYTVGSRFGGVPFTVDVSEPKPNGPNTMNLVEKRAWKLGLCEDAFNGRAGSLGNWIVNSVVGGKVKARPRSSAGDDFFFSSSDTPPIELPGVFRIAVPPFFVKSPWLYILLFSSSWSSICRLRKSPLKCLSYPALPSTCFEW